MSIKVVQGDCIHVVRLLADAGPIDCIFADPPDNIGLGYDDYKDKLSEEAYLQKCWDWLNCFLAASPVVWWSFNAKWTTQMGMVVESLKQGYKFNVKPCVQTFTFGQHNHHDFGNCHRPLWRLSRPDWKCKTDEIRVPSWRQENGDPRADPRGRVPGDTFDFDLLPETAYAFPRVTGNSKQRRSWHPTQLHEGLVERCILSSTDKADLVVDPFGGTGTTGRVCKKIERDCILIDLSPEYCERMRAELCV
jgi:DNA modification methylase